MSALYVVATPIGNLEDLTTRAARVLREVDVIAAEDTRHTAKLLSANAIQTPVVACHDHNEAEVAGTLVQRLVRGEQVALVSDAGTPLLSDPGYRLVRAALDAGVRVVPVPGASALTAALSVAGLPTDRFCFEGFLSAKQAQRVRQLEALAREPRTIVLYEAPHRIQALVQDVVTTLGGAREISIARELTKQYEQVWSGTASAAADALADGSIPQKGEFVVLIGGAPRSDDGVTEDDRRAMSLLLQELPPGKAAALGAELLGKPRKVLYDIALQLKKE